MKKTALKIPFFSLLVIALIILNIYIFKIPAGTPSAGTALSPSDVSQSDSLLFTSPTDFSPTDSVADIEFTASESDPAAVDLNQYALVTVKKASVRESNSSDSKRVGYAYKDDKVIVLEQKKSWCKVDMDGSFGWIHIDCLEFIRNRDLEATIYLPIPQQIQGQVQSLKGTATEKYIKEIAADHKAAGLSVAVIQNGDVAYNYEYGYADTDDKREITPNTKFRIASLSKVFTSMMAVKLSEDGKLDLDAHIGDILGMKVQNPKYKDSDITTRMLLTHSSSIRDKDIIFSAYLKKDLSDKNSYASYKPGSKHAYSNLGIGIAGAVVEKASGQLLTDYAQSAFFDPMGIDAGFDGKKLNDKKDVADCMTRGTLTKSAAELVKSKETDSIGRNHSIAAGGLLISAVDMARLTTILINNGVYNGERYLSDATLQEFHTPQIEASKYTQCIGIRKSDTILPQRTVYFHTGASYGVFSVMVYDLEDKSGVIVLSTGSLDYSDNNGIRTICSDIVNLIYEDILNT